MQLGANGTRLLIALGLEAAMRQVVCSATGKEIRLGTTGQCWRTFDLGRHVGRAVWSAVLDGASRRLPPRAAGCGAAGRPGAVRVGNGCVGFDQATDRVTLHLANGDHVTGDVLIGADGVHSRVRQQMFGQGSAHFTGIMAWRGLVPMQRLPPHQRRLVGANWIGVGGHVVTYPLRRGEILNFVGVVERDDWRVESWTEPGSHEECLRDLANWHEDVKTIIRNIDTPFKWALLGREPLDHYARGRVCVMGDAAHPTLPFLAQGANMALEDADHHRPLSGCVRRPESRSGATRLPACSERPRSCGDRRTTRNGSITSSWARGGRGSLRGAGVHVRDSPQAL